MTPESKTHEIWNIRFINKIIDAMADGVFTMDAEGRISSWNPAMERISGYTAHEALGKTCQLLQCSRCFGKNCPADIHKCRILEEGHSEAKECLLRHKSGHTIPVIKNASVVRDDQNHIVGVVETVTDLTELNRARKEANEAYLRLGELHRMYNIIGKSRAMKQVFMAISAAAESEATVLIQGESGDGAKNWWPGPSTTTAIAGTAPWYPSTAAPWRRICSKANCSATSKGPSPAPTAIAWGVSRRPRAAPSSWTRSVN